MKILVADDSKFYLKSLAITLTDWGYEVITARNGREAMARLQEPEPARIAILDCVMPELSGLELCRQLRREELPYTYIILISAQRDHQDVMRGFDLGADDYIGKPFEEVELRARLKAGERIMKVQAELVAAQQQLARQAQLDSLTELWNHAAILRILAGEMERSKRFRLPLSICLLDLDHFKAVNDRFGHLVGDQVLREVSGTFRRIVREYDYVGRYGGEEFLVVAPESPSNDAVKIGERLRAAVAAAQFATSGLSVTLSVGVATWMEEESCDGLMIRADSALYRAKREGRNQVQLAPAT